MNIKTMLQKEDRVPLFLLLLSIVFATLTFAEPLLNTLLEKEEMLSGKEIGIVGAIGLVVVLLLVSLVIVGKRALVKDVQKSDNDKDERELLHDYLVARSGYNTLLYGICFYLFFFSEGSVSNTFIPLLLLGTLVVRAVKRNKLEQEL